MPDEADYANDRVALRDKVASEVRKPEGPLATGWCYNCTEPLAAGMRWCDADCRDDWENLENRNEQI